MKAVAVIAGLMMMIFAAESAEAAKPIIDSECVSQILSNLYVSKRDVSLYKKIFRALAANDIKEADQLAKDVNNQILMGHVKAEKYLSRGYKASYDELKRWLEVYYDHPQAPRIYKLAASRGGKKGLVDPDENKPAPKRSPYSWYNNDYENLTPANRGLVRKKVTEFRRYINKGKTKAARNILENHTFRMAIPNREYDAMSATLATVYLLDNQDKLALQWVKKASRRSNDATAQWIGGLAAWRLGDYKTSAAYFANLGSQSDNDEWLVAAGAYWAHRAYHKLNKPKEAGKWLKIASKYKRTFYGMLANYQLGQPWDFNWDGVSYLNDFNNYDYLNEMMASASIQRAIILIWAKNKNLAEKELRRSYAGMTVKQKETVLYLAKQYNMHSLAIRISNDIKDNEQCRFYDDIAYPVPDWRPKSGWKVNRALVLALVRQESAFTPTARSASGARGLMQLMPNTAVHVTKDRSLKRDSSPLYDTEYNMEVGQQYVNYLLQKPFVNGNLFFLAAAYNAGPGNLYKWQKSARYKDDPLLFIEVIPARETRIYIERVMANFWAYNARFNETHKSMDELVSGRWPTL